jgi:signal transduction histidine kinase
VIHVQRWLLNLGLWPRMSIGISLGFLILFVAFSLLGERALQDSSERLLEERQVIAQMTASHLDGLLQQAVDELKRAERFADYSLAAPPGMAPPLATVSRTAGDVQTNQALTAENHLLALPYERLSTFAPGIAVLDATGHVVVSHPPELYPPNADLSQRACVARALERRAVTISAPYHDDYAGLPTAAVFVPIFDESRFLGLLQGTIDLRSAPVMDALQQAAMIGDSGHAFLVDEQGRTLASTFDLPFLAPGEHASFYRQAMAQGEPVVDTVVNELNWPNERSNHSHVMAFAPLQMAPWAIAIGGDVHETFAGVRRLRIGLAVLGIIALAGTWVTTLVGTRLLVRPVEHLTQSAQRIAAGDLQTPLEASEGGEIGAMADALEQMRKLLLTNIRELATWNETLEARVAEHTAKLHQEQQMTQQLLRRVITAQEEERTRISWELHDEIGQTLTAVQLSLDRLARTPAKEAERRERLERARMLTAHALAELRHLIAALRPGVLDQLGLAPALNWVADHTLRPLGLEVTIEAVGLTDRLPGELETILFRIAQEAMSNVARHSDAQQLDVQLAHTDGQVTMTLTDDGRGFDLSAVTSTPSQMHGLGLAGMQERASLAGGQVTVKSAPGQGTTVHVALSLPAEIKNRAVKSPAVARRV